MRKQPLLVVAAVAWMLAMPGRSLARIEASFQWEECAWNATDIVVAEQKGKTVTVLETWKGSCAKGTSIHGLDLPDSPLEVATWDKGGARKTVSGSRIVLFLKHAESNALPPAEEEMWSAASRFGGATVSAVWLEAGQAYSIQQPRNPGPAELWPLKQDEAGFKRETQDILDARDALTKAQAMTDATQRVRILEPMARGKYWHQRHEALALMGECGPAALPILRQMMREYGRDTSTVAAALAKAAGESAGAEMTTVLKEELEFWRKTAPGLPVGWWNNLPENRERLQHRYGILQPALDAVSTSHLAAAQEVVRDLRDLWISLPQLNDKSGLDQITDKCNKVLKALD